MPPHDDANCPLTAEHSGQVIDAPHYIRVRANWLEKALLLAVLSQIMLSAVFLVYGSNAARHAEEISRGNRDLLCERIFDVSPELYTQYLRYCPER